MEPVTVRPSSTRRRWSAGPRQERHEDGRAARGRGRHGLRHHVGDARGSTLSRRPVRRSAPYLLRTVASVPPVAWNTSVARGGRRGEPGGVRVGHDDPRGAGRHGRHDRAQSHAPAAERTATVLPGETLSNVPTAPAPVMMPQPRGASTDDRAGEVPGTLMRLAWAGTARSRRRTTARRNGRAPARPRRCRSPDGTSARRAPKFSGKWRGQ